MPPAWVLIVLALISAGTTIVTSRPVHNAAVTTQRAIVNTSKKTGHTIVHVVTLGKK